MEQQASGNPAFADIFKAAIQRAKEGFKQGAVEKYLQTGSGQAVVREAENQTIASHARNPATWLVIGGVAVALLFIGGKLKG